MLAIGITWLITIPVMPTARKRRSRAFRFAGTEPRGGERVLSRGGGALVDNKRQVFDGTSRVTIFQQDHAQPLIIPTSAQGGPADASGRLQYRLRAINNELMTRSLESTAGFSDVYSVMFSLRYQF